MPANDPKSKSSETTDVGSSEKRFKMKNPVISRLLDMARRAQENPEAFRTEFVSDAARVGDDVEKAVAFANAARASIKNNPQVKRQLENFLLQVAGRSVERAVEKSPGVRRESSRRAPQEKVRSSAPLTVEEAHEEYHRSHAHEPRRRHHPQPYSASPLDEFVRELFFRRGRRSRRR
jgi:hypothetical protein